MEVIDLNSPSARSSRSTSSQNHLLQPIPLSPPRIAFEAPAPVLAALSPPQETTASTPSSPPSCGDDGVGARHLGDYTPECFLSYASNILAATSPCKASGVDLDENL